MFQARCLLLDWDAEVWKGCKGLRCLGLCTLVVVEGVDQPCEMLVVIEYQTECLPWGR